jgi:uncharacterized protein (TIGR02271 family)
MTVHDINGRTGTIIGEETSAAGQRLVIVELDGGGLVQLRPELLLPVGDREFRVDRSFDDPYSSSGTVASHAERAEGAATIDATSVVDESPVVVPVVEEQLRVRKRIVEKARVRISKSIGERTEVVETPLMSEHVTVDRVEVNQIVDEAPEVRREGDVTIIPVFEEVLVVEKKLLLREEIHVRWGRTEEIHREEVSLRSEAVHIERIESDDGTSEAGRAGRGDAGEPGSR